MATTNKQIIETECLLHNINEEVHTYARWQDLGYQVKRGSKALFQTEIWKHVSIHGKVQNQEIETSKMFMKKSSFFGRSQVEKIEKN